MKALNSLSKTVNYAFNGTLQKVITPYVVSRMARLCLENGSRTALQSFFFSSVLRIVAMCLLVTIGVGSVWGTPATAGTVLFSENFGAYDTDGYKTDGSVSSSTGNRVIYGGGSVTYDFTNGSGTSAGTTQIKMGNSESYAGGSSPELMVGKKGSGTGAAGGSFEISGIPNGGAAVITISYKQNAQGLNATVTGTGYSTEFVYSNTLGTTSFDVTVADNADATFTLTLQARGTNNVRVDDISITVKTAGAGEDCSSPDPTLAVSVAEATVYAGVKTQLSTTGGNGTTVTYTVISANSTYATIDGSNKFSATRPGTYTVQASQDASGGVCGGTSTVNITVRYQVKWSVNGDDSYSTGSPTAYVDTHDTKVATLPTAPGSALCDGSKVFVGWTATAIPTTTNTKPTDLFVTAAAAPNVIDNVTYYAVFATGGNVTFAAATASGLTEDPSLTWTNSTSGVSLTIAAGQRYTGAEPYTWSVNKGSYATVAITSGNIAHIVATLSESKYYIKTVGTGTLATSSTTQTITNIFASSVRLNAQPTGNSNNQIRMTSFDVTYVSATPAYATACCTQLGGIGGSVAFTNPKEAVLTWNAMSHVDATTPYTIKYKTHDAGAYTTFAGSITTNGAGKKTCTITGLSCNTDYDFKIEVTAASDYCDKDSVMENKNSGKWNVTYTLSNVTLASGQTAGTGVLCGDYSATFEPTSVDYERPSSVTVTGASSHTWNKATGELTISGANITGHITVSITADVVANFTNNSTVFIQAESSSAWDASACVKAWFNNSGADGAAQTTYWLFDASAPDAGKKLFATVVPSSGTLNQVTLQRFASNCSDFYNNNGTLTKASCGGSNTFRTNGSGTSNVAWNATGVTLSLYGDPNSWESPLATMADQGAGVWTATYSNYAPSETSADFKISTNYNGWIGHTGSNSNATLSGMTVGSTYNVTATLDITDHSLVMSKTYVKGTVHFDMQGHGSAIADLTNVLANAKISAPSAPTAAGYTFGGWYKDAECTDDWDFSTDQVAETMTLYAKWTVKNCTITLNNQGATTAGTESVTATYDANTNLTSSITKPTKTGSTFKGYYTGVGGSGVQLIDANGAWIASVSGYTDAGKNWQYDGTSLTLYAVWGYTVTYANENGTEISHSDVTAGGSVTLPNQDACVGFEFFGWSTVKITSETTTKPSGASFIGKNGASYTPSRDTTLYPIYARVEGYSMTKDTLTVDNTGMTGSYASHNNINKDSVGVNSNAVYSIYALKSSGIQFKASGGDNSGLVVTTSGGKLDSIAVHIPYASSYGYHIYTYTSTTAYALSEIPSTIHGSNTWDLYHESKSPSDGRWYGHHFTDSTTFCMYASATAKVDTIIIFWGSGTYYYATHCETATDVTITYNGNGGTPGCGEAIDDDAFGNKQKTVTWDYKSSGADAPTLASSQTICSSATRSGYVLLKWNTSADGSGRDYTSGATVTRFGGDSTLYAIWRPVYTVEYYDKNEGTPLVASETQALYGAAVDVPDNPTACSGSWTFVGWTDNANQLAAEPVRPNIVVSAGASSYTPTANIKLYAVFSKSYETCDNFAAGVSGTYIISQTVSGTTSYVQSTGNAARYDVSSADGANATAERFTIGYSPFKRKYTIRTSSGYLAYDSSDGKLTKGNSSPYYWNIASSGSGWKIKPADEASKWLTVSTYFNILGSDYTALNFTKATTTYYYTIQSCDATHTIKFHNGGGTINNPASVPVGSWNSSTKVLSGLSDCDKVTKWPTATYEGWNFLGWSPEDYSNSGKHTADHEDENGSTSEPGSDIIYGNDANDYTVLGGNIELYPVFTRLPNNEPFDTDAGGDYVMYYIESGSDDGYGAEVRIYVGAYEDGKRYKTTSSCASARVFTFTKDEDVWHIYDKTAGKYIAGVYGDNDLVHRDNLSGTYDDWTITIKNGNQFDAYCQGGGRYISFSTTAGTFADYSVISSPNLYKQVYLGSCEERIFSSEPKTVAEITLTGSPIVTSSAGQTIRATEKLELAARNLDASATKVTLSGTNLTFATSATATPEADLEISVVSNRIAATDIYVYYTPVATSDGTESIIVTAEDDASSNSKSATCSVFARHLPDNFIVAAQASDGNWYALPADITSSSSPTDGRLITVDDIDNPTYATAAPNTTMWGLRQVKDARRTSAGIGNYLTFTERLSTATADNQKALYNGSTTSIQVYTTWAAYDDARYEWIPASSDLKDYTLTSSAILGEEASARTLSLENGGYFGSLLMDKAYEGKVRLLPATFYEAAEAQIIEWKANSVVIMYKGSDATATTKVGAKIASDAQTLASQKLTHGIYELTTGTGDKALTSNAGAILDIEFASGAHLKAEIPVIINSSITAEDGHGKQDVVILNGGTLTAANDKYSYKNVMVYGGGKLSIPSGKQLGMNKLTLRAGGITTDGSGGSAAYAYVYPQVYLGGGTWSKSNPNIYYEYITDYDHWYHLCLPFDANHTSITYPLEYYGSNVKSGNKGSWIIKRYDGATRATGNNDAWVDIETDGEPKTIYKGKGYIYWGAPKKINDGTSTARPAWGLQRMTMVNVTADAATAAETDDKTITGLGSWTGVVGNTGKDNDQGWNLIGNPYMANITDLAVTGLQTGKLVKVTDENNNWTGRWEWNDESDVRYLTIPDRHFETYSAKTIPVAMAAGDLNTGHVFFVQLEGEANSITFDTDDRAGAPHRYWQLAQTSINVETGIVLSHETLADEVNFWIKDGKTEAYEFNADYPKTPNKTDFNIYGVHASGDLSWVAVGPETAEQAMAIGYQVPAAGEYMLSLSERYDAEELEALYVTDHALLPEVTTNLVEQNYMFMVNQAETNNERFTVSVKLKKQDEVATDSGPGIATDVGAVKFIYDDKIYICLRGVIYDATGKRVNTVNK